MRVYRVSENWWYLRVPSRVTIKVPLKGPMRVYGVSEKLGVP